MYNKNTIDADAEREAQALSKQGKVERRGKLINRLRSEHDYNKVEFDKLFRS